MIKGLQLDKDVKFISQEEYTYALNAVTSSSDGEIFNSITEPGNFECLELPNNYKLIGSIELIGNSNLLFITNNINSIVATLDNDCNYEELISTTCLQFKTSNHIDGFFRILNGCDRIIYFTDNLNDYRSINIDKLDSYKLDTGEWDCDLFNHFKSGNTPELNNYEVLNNGGNLITGSYEFAFSYIDQNNNNTNWIPLTSPISIYNESNLNQNISGNYNIDYFTYEQGGLSNSSKSIKFNFSYLDESFKSYQLAVIRKVEGIGVITDVHLLEEIPITLTSFTYTGNENFTTTDISSINIDSEIFSKVLSHDFTNGRLLLSNVEKPSYDWSQFQIQANNIKSKYVVSNISKDNLDTKGFMRDEVYAFGIVWVMNDGTVSPAFHIPGREKDIPIDNTNIHTRPDAINTWDSEQIQAQWDSTDLTGVFSGESERWQVYNTALKDTTVISGYDSSGELAYYDNDLLYPDTKNCNNEFIYPQTKVRFHKFPDTTLEHHVTKDYVRKLGINFSNIIIPTEYIALVKGYYIVKNKYNEGDTTVKGKGLLVNGWENVIRADVSSDNISHIHMALEAVPTNGLADGSSNAIKSPKNNYFMSPEHLLNKRFINGSHYKSELNINNFDIPTQPGGTVIYEEQDFVLPTLVNRGLVGNISLPFTDASEGYSGKYLYGRTVNLNNKTIVHNSLSTSILHSELIADWDDYNNQGKEGITLISYASLKNQINLFLNIENILYSNCTNTLSLSTEVSTFNGDSYIGRFNFDMGYSPYSDSFDFQGGVTFIYSFYCESRIDLNLRVSGGSDCNKIFKYGDSVENYANRHPLKTINQLSNYYCNEYYAVNNDYNSGEENKLFLPNKYSESDCDGCANKFPNRIYYSEKSDSEDSVDNLTKILPNNYTIIPETEGEILNIFMYKNILYIQTEKSIYALPTRTQILDSTTETIALGTGDFLSIEPNKLSEIGYGGIYNKFAFKKTEFGVTWVDEYSGKIFNFTNQFKDVGAQKISYWLKNNLSINLTKYVPELNSNEIGFNIIYDKYFERLLFIKKDFIPINDFKLNSTTVGEFTFLNGEFGIKTVDSLDKIEFENKDYFENKSWTLSYHLPTDSWTSFHSYLPYFGYNNGNDFFTSKDNVLYKHEKDKSFQFFYNKKNDYIIEVVNNTDPFITKVFNSLIYISDVELDDEIVEGVTFNKFIAYTNKQSTGLKNLKIKELYDSADFSIDTSLVTEDEEYWSINNIRDLSTSNKIKSIEWEDIKDDYFTDFVPINIDLNKDIYYQSKIRDKFIKIRLIFNQEEDYKLKMSLNTTKNNKI